MYSQRQEDLGLFSSHLEAKKAGPLVCPICVIESEPQFAYAACTNCGYSIFFDTDYLPRTRR
jgi:hypothetical protein